MRKSITRGLGALTPDAWREIAGAVDFVRDFGPRLKLLAGDTTRGLELPLSREITARLTGAAKIAGSARWRYAWEEVRLDPETDLWETVTGGLVGSTTVKYALNRQEGANSSVLAFGYNADDTILTDHPDYVAGSVSGNAIVRLSLVRGADGSVVFEFDGLNVIDGTCPEGSAILPSPNPLDVWNALGGEAGAPSIIRTGDPALKGLRLIGAASQVADLLTAEDDGGNALARIDAAGVVIGTALKVGTTPAVLETRTITAGTGLTGGGDLSANRTLSVADRLAAINAASWAADKLIYCTGSLTVALADLTSYGRSLIAAANAAAARGTLGLAIGSDVQSYNATLASLAGISGVAGRIPYFTGAAALDASAGLTFDPATGRMVLNGAGFTFTDLAQLRIGIGNGAKGMSLEATGGGGAYADYYILCRGPAGEPYFYVAGNGSPRSAYTSARFPWYEGFNYHQLDMNTSGELWLKGGAVGSVVKWFGYVAASNAFDVYDSTGAARCRLAVNSSGDATLTPDSGALDLAASATITRGGGTGTPGRCLYANTADSSAVANTTSETAFDINYSLPAGLLNAVGRKLRITARGREACTGTVNATLRLKCGSTVLFATANLRMATASSLWELSGIVTCRTSGSSGALFTTCGAQRVGATTGTAVGQSSGTINLTAGHTVQISIQMDVANAANTATLEELTIEAVNC